VTRAAAQAVKGTLEKPIFVWCYFGIAAGRTDDGDFIGRKNALAKGVLTVALTLGCAFRPVFRFIPVLIFRNSGFSAEFPDSGGTHTGIKSFQGKINLD
jgi:hypothetical protein